MSSRSTAKPRRRRASAASRLRPFWVLITFILIAAVAAGYFFAAWPALRPHKIEVIGNRIVRSSEIVAKAAVDRNRNLWLQNTGAMTARVESIPYVGVASVHRMLPATLTIAVTERVPFATLRIDGTRVVVDHDLRVLEPAPGETKDLPTFTLSASKLSLQPGMFLNDAALRQLRTDYDILASAHVTPDALDTDKYGELEATLHSGVRLLLGDDEDLQKKIPLINPILSQLQRERRPIAAIDLRAPNTPIVRYRK